MWVQGLRAKDVGLYLSTLKHTPIEAGMILLAIPVGIIEYQILEPPLLPGLGSGAANFIAASLIFVVCTGFLEELVFRGLIQHNAIKLMSKWWGILFVSTIFGVLHVGNLALWDCVLAFSLGFIYSIVREKTGSIYGISISHGIINTILFLIAPTITITI
jgi:membrane protease YdiL (CAAX protease family)